MHTSLIVTMALMNKKSNEFSHNTQGWQCLHFCATSNKNKLEVVTSAINFYATLHL